MNKNIHEEELFGYAQEFTTVPQVTPRDQEIARLAKENNQLKMELREMHTQQQAYVGKEQLKFIGFERQIQEQSSRIEEQEYQIMQQENTLEQQDKTIRQLRKLLHFKDQHLRELSHMESENDRVYQKSAQQNKKIADLTEDNETLYEEIDELQKQEANRVARPAIEESKEDDEVSMIDESLLRGGALWSDSTYSIKRRKWDGDITFSVYSCIIISH